LAIWGIGPSRTPAAVPQWSTTPASNASSDPNINWREGQPPSSINDSARSMMAQLAFWRDSFSGALTTAGTSSAYTLTTGLSLSATPNNGQFLCFVPNVTNDAAPVLSADGGTNYPIQTSPGVAVGSATLIQGTPYCISFNNSANSWVLFAVYANTLDVPLGTLLDYVGSSAPNSNFVLAYGQAISRTTYSAFFSLVGTTFGTGDGTTTFNVPDLRGRMTSGLDNMGGSAAGRVGTALVTDGGTLNGQLLGSAAGSQNHAQTTAEMVAHNHTVNITDPGHAHTLNNATEVVRFLGSGLALSGNIAFSTQDLTNQIATATTGLNSSNVTTANAGSGGAMAIMPPAMMLNKIIRIQHHDDSFDPDALDAILATRDIPDRLISRME
jgi:microcystin-dependent protein